MVPVPGQAVILAVHVDGVRQGDQGQLAIPQGGDAAGGRGGWGS